MRATVLLILLAAPPNFAQTSNRQLTYDDWTVMLSDDKKDLIAATGQDNDKFLAYRCFTKAAKCVHVIVMATSCDDGHRYPVLINASSGSLTVDCLCSENEGTYELLPTDFDGFHRILTDSTGHVGFALPLASGQFKVVRFSLTGAKRAMAAAEAAARRKDSAEYH